MIAHAMYGRSVGKAHEKLGEAKKAASHMSDALAIFRRTVGYDSPLTANAMGALGKVTAALGAYGTLPYQPGSPLTPCPTSLTAH